MRYIPILTHISETEASFEIRIISKKLEREVGIGSCIFCKKDGNVKMVQFEYYVPERFYVSENEVESICKKSLKAMEENGKMVV